LGYISSQEVALFTDLLREGNLPEVAVFMDGMNEFGPEFENARLYFKARVDFEPSSSMLWGAAIRSLPLLRAATDFQMYAQRLIPKSNNSTDSISARERIDRWRKNKKIIESLGREFGVKILFVWQPVPVYKYDMKNHLFASGFETAPDWELNEIQVMKNAYALIDEQKDRGVFGDNILWLQDLQSNLSQNVYVDMWHYNAPFSLEIAHLIASAICQEPKDQELSEP
jgi:hypothetical protein